MAASADYLHDEQVLDAVLDQLKLYLPSKWTTGTNPIYKLQELEFGDLRDYYLADDETSRNLCPMILCKLTGNQWVEPESGIGGKMMIEHQIRVVHIWTADQRHDETTGRTIINPTRSKHQRAAVVNKALFGDTALRRLGSPTLTTDDAGYSALVICTDYVRTTYEGLSEIDSLQGDFYGFAIDITVRTLTQ